METSSVRSLSQLSFFIPKPNRNKPYPSWPCKKPRTTQPPRLYCQKMYVPGFGEASPEKKAAKNLHNFFTYIAVRIVSAQLQSYNPEAYEDLMEFLSRHSLNDGDKFCAELMRESSRHKGLGNADHISLFAMRILEVRSSYCKNDFEWDNLKRLSVTVRIQSIVEESNTRLMRDYVVETSHTLESEK
ncbi:hypothetical protein SADUNF_Sadunf11G0006700 [Salix dunnii]|uniref:Chaperonin-like RBCX protein 1, chloroplastic n=1 Tax=Salix dunnii TaxID=1413687 RepID=A0A835MNL1_9ROSI|nr:hypothetical protein SADUNF_Sadunf11G0006700 [Salix dunnii]